jgi:glycosyltransferase involved in cell wall biosynthesis
MISVVIPAHNEAGVIEQSLRALTDGAQPGELEVIVVCNGCRDATAEIARRFGEPVRVLETSVASKSNSLDMGDQAATGFPRIYADADVMLTLDSVRELAKALESGEILAAAPAADTVFAANTHWAVRAYYDLWMALPYVQEGMIAAGVYALSEKGRRRFDRFPNLIADDGFIRAQFAPGERRKVDSAISVVRAPATVWGLILIKTRSRLGFYELKQRFPELFVREAHTKDYGKALWAVLRRPRLWAGVFPYLWVNAFSRYRARKQLQRLSDYVWERDNSSRTMSSDKAASPGPDR